LKTWLILQKYSAPAVIFRLQSGSFECQLWVRVMHLLIGAKLPNSSQLIWRPPEPVAILVYAELLASVVAARGAVIVSGLARGIDAAAHRGALSAWTPEKRAGRTIAVLGTPLSFPWPPENARLADEIAESGLILSECPQAEGRRFDPEARARSLKRRNRLVAALGTGTLVMAARPGSSTLIEVQAALAIGRPVILWQACTQESWAEDLLKNAPKDAEGRSLVAAAGSAREVEALLSPWARVWWL